MPLHPQVRAMLDQMEESGLPQLNELPPVDARAQAKLMTELVGPGPEVARVSEFSIPTSEGEISARRYVPADAAGVILWIHGGGWVICDLDTHDAVCRLLATASACRVIAVDYRRAPEHPFPAPLEDCWDALLAVAEANGDEPMVIAGDSAGGNMAAACTLRARDRGGAELVAQLLVCPVVDHDMTTVSYRERGSGAELFLTAKEMEWFWNHYAPEPRVRIDPEASPLRAASFAGLPPAVVVTAGFDVLRDEGTEYARRLADAGVPVEHRHFERQTHLFFTLVNVLPASIEAIDYVCAAAERALAGTWA